MAQAATIKELIVAAAEGAGEGVAEIQSANIPVELDQFEIEVTYSAETEVTTRSGGGLSLNFRIFKANYGRRRSSRATETYGLKVRFLFTGVNPEPTT